MQSGGLPSYSINFPCGLETFCQFLSTFCAAISPSVKFPYVRKTFRQLPSTFCASFTPFSPSVNFHQILCCWKTIHPLPSTSHANGRSSGNFRQFSLWPGDLPSNSVNILCGQWIFREISVQPGDLPSSSVNFTYG